jgi:hypothetical protein
VHIVQFLLEQEYQHLCERAAVPRNVRLAWAEERLSARSKEATLRTVGAGFSVVFDNVASETSLKGDEVPEGGVGVRPQPHEADSALEAQLKALGRQAAPPKALSLAALV